MSERRRYGPNKYTARGIVATITLAPVVTAATVVVVGGGLFVIDWVGNAFTGAQTHTDEWCFNVLIVATLAALVAFLSAIAIVSDKESPPKEKPTAQAQSGPGGDPLWVTLTFGALLVVGLVHAGPHILTHAAAMAMRNNKRS